MGKKISGVSDIVYVKSIFHREKDQFFFESYFGGPIFHSLIFPIKCLEI